MGFLAAPGSASLLPTHRKEVNMNWDRIEDDCRQFNGNVIEQWDDLTEHQLGSRIRETYFSSNDEPEYERTDWQQRLSEIERAAHQGQ